MSVWMPCWSLHCSEWKETKESTKRTVNHINKKDPNFFGANSSSFLPLPLVDFFKNTWTRRSAGVLMEKYFQSVQLKTKLEQNESNSSISTEQKSDSTNPSLCFNPVESITRELPWKITKEGKYGYSSNDCIFLACRRQYELKYEQMKYISMWTFWIYI